MNSYEMCRRKIVGWDVNPPDPFPGFGGTVGLGQDCAELANGDWLLMFHAGYWHMSMATPLAVPEEQVLTWVKSGLRREIEAPRGGRTMSIRSSDGGVTWSKPETVLNGRWDESPVGMNCLPDGTVLVYVNNQASWYGRAGPPENSDHLPVNTRIGVIRSEDNGYTWSEPVWLECPYAFYQRAYAQAIELPDGGLLYPTYGNPGDGRRLCGVIHRSDDGGRSWRVISTIERENGTIDLDEPSIVRLADGRLMLITRLDAALFYSEDDGVTWALSHHAPFEPIKPSRMVTLKDGTVVIWMTSHGKLRASWSTDSGATWHTDEEGKPFALDPELYGYPGGFLMKDESVFVVYYDAANQQQRTGVWGIRFQIDDTREHLEILPAPGADATEPVADAEVGDEELDADAVTRG